jgi:hypothetical protein
LNFSCFARLDRVPDLEQKCLVVVSSCGLRIRAHVTLVVAEAKRLLYESVRPLPLVAGFLKDLTRSRGQLIAENALLRQQLIVASRKVKRPPFKDSERGLLVLLSRIVHGWQNAVLLVKPETILRWHREGFRLFWRWKSRKRKPAESKISAEQIALIRRMAEENRLWGAERMHCAFGTEFDRVARGAGMKVVRTAARSPLMNATCERYLGSVRRECLDHIIILGQRHLAHVLEIYSRDYFNRARPHQGIGQRLPVAVATEKFIAGATIRSVPVLGGLHHDYRVAA